MAKADKNILDFISNLKKGDIIKNAIVKSMTKTKQDEKKVYLKNLKQVGNNNQNMIAINTTSETIVSEIKTKNDNSNNNPILSDIIDDKLPEIENENDYIGGKYFIMFGNTYDLNRKLKFKDHGGTSLIKLRYKDKNKNKIGWFLPTTIKAKVQKIVSKMKLDGKIFFYYL